ncbi:flotillin family protein [Myxococcota bacterium]|nr:flotillin family protein [Myxococcota bacterium]
MTTIILAVGAGIALLILLRALLAMVQTVGPNEALIVSGHGEPRVVVGGRTVVWPVINRADRLTLEVLTIDVHNRQVYTAQGIAMDVDGVAQIAVRNDEASIRTAARQFIGRKTVEVAGVAKQTMEGHLRAILGQMTVEEIYKERDKFAQAVQHHAASDMQKMGLGIVSFTLRDVKDGEGYLEALGRPRLAVVRRDAQIAEAEARRDADIAQAQATREAAINTADAKRVSEVAQLQAQTKIAEAERDYKLNLATYQEQENTARAKSEAAFEIEKRIQAIVVNEKEAMRIEKELEATVKKPAEARKYAAEVDAQAQKYRTVADAEAKAQAAKAHGEATAEADKARGIAEAEVQRARGLADADAIRARGLAEAEAMERKAEAFKQYNDAAVGQMFLQVLPELARAIAAPLERTEKIVVMGGDGGGVSRLTGEVVSAMAQLPPLVRSMTGIDVQRLIGRLADTDDTRAEAPAAEPLRGNAAKPTGGPGSR